MYDSKCCRFSFQSCISGRLSHHLSSLIEYFEENSFIFFAHLTFHFNWKPQMGTLFWHQTRKTEPIICRLLFLDIQSKYFFNNLFLHALMITFLTKYQRKSGIVYNKNKFYFVEYNVRMSEIEIFCRFGYFPFISLKILNKNLLTLNSPFWCKIFFSFLLFSRV